MEEGRWKMEAKAAGSGEFPSLKRNDAVIPALLAQTDSVSAS
jgi:hypothetical protein